MEVAVVDLGDCLPLIFNCLTSLKDKVRLERVCKTFRKHARCFAAWSNVTNLIVKDKDGNHLINGEYIRNVHLESAIKAIVLRIRNVQVIDLNLCAQPIAYWSVASTIVQHGVRSYRNVKGLYLIGRNLEAFSLFIYQLVAVLKSQLETLILVGIFFTDSNDMTRLWNHIGSCCHLKLLVFIQTSNEKNEKNLPDTIKMALRGKPIESLEISIAGIKTDHLIEIISSLCDRHPLRSLGCISHFQSLIDLARTLPDIHRNSLHHIAFQKTDDYENNFWPKIFNLPRRFPQLTTLDLCLRRGVSIYEVLNVIVTYLPILNEEKSERFICFKLFLNRNFLDQLRSDLSRAVFAALVKRHKCKIFTRTDGTFLFRFDVKEHACIELWI